ncbi:MAG: transporter associated domain-containing protein, partial [Isosphaeraceae bacterium]
TDAETVGGLILDILGRLARVGDAVDVDQHRLTVVRAEPTRIRQVRVERISPSESAVPSADADQPRVSE